MQVDMRARRGSFYRCGVHGFEAEQSDVVRQTAAVGQAELAQGFTSHRGILRRF
jgi:hypothetical protein